MPMAQNGSAPSTSMKNSCTSLAGGQLPLPRVSAMMVSSTR